VVDDFASGLPIFHTGGSTGFAAFLVGAALLSSSFLSSLQQEGGAPPPLACFFRLFGQLFRLSLGRTFRGCYWNHLLVVLDLPWPTNVGCWLLLWIICLWLCYTGIVAVVVVVVVVAASSSIARNDFIMMMP
jgi:hypothetical protein